jgi:hypothetical protein
MGLRSVSFRSQYARRGSEGRGTDVVSLEKVKEGQKSDGKAGGGRVGRTV